MFWTSRRQSVILTAPGSTPRRGDIVLANWGIWPGSADNDTGRVEGRHCGPPARISRRKIGGAAARECLRGVRRLP